MPYKYNPFTNTFDDSTPGPAGTVSAAGSGTAAAPGIAFSSDTNTGIYNPGADQFGISTGGTGRVLVDASGNVGINTTSPQNSFSIGSASSGQIGLSLDWTGAGGPYQVAGLTADRSTGEIRSYGYTNFYQTFYTNNLERLRIKANGIINFSNVPTYADNTTATAGGLAVGDVYKTVLGILMIRY